MSIIVWILEISNEILIWFVFKSIHSFLKLFLLGILFLLYAFETLSVDLLLLTDHLNLFHSVVVSKDCVELDFTDSGGWLIHDGVGKPKDLTDFHTQNDESISKNSVILAHAVVSRISSVSSASWSFNTVDSCKLNNAKTNWNQDS